MYPYGLVGNCQTSALVKQDGSLEWMCCPRPDSPPVFARLLDGDGGYFSIEGTGNYQGQQSYLPNTNVLKTMLSDDHGNKFVITDFCPRFEQHGRNYRPISLFRVVSPLAGSPTIKVVCRPINGWEKSPLKPIRGNSHVRWETRNEDLRLATNMPLTYLMEETPFTLKDTIYLGLTWGFGIEEDIPQVTQRFLAQTIEYWHRWVKHCSTPSLFQKETIRSALTLKLHCYEDTGAILAALTSSLPEEIGATRNWDYRFCWLRDAYFTLSAFHNLGHFEEMEGFIKFLLNIAQKHDHYKERLHPVYRLDQSLPLPEIEYLNWRGYHNSQPVRNNNKAAEHIQNDVYGEMILTLAPIFFDERFYSLRTPDHEDLLAHLGKFCAKNISQPDAGLWEIRDGWQEHSFSNLMCWAGLDRMEKIQQRGFLKDLNLGTAKASAERALRSSVKAGVLRNGPKDESLDASLLLLPLLRFPDDHLCRMTVEKISEELKLKDGDAYLYRYIRRDDFGSPQSAFVICSFWLAQALARIGKADDAMQIMNKLMPASNSLGLFSEHFYPGQRLQAGNFPQAYSHVGQINAAFMISPPWTDVL